MKKPFLHALGAAIYIASIVLIINYGGKLEIRETVIIPMAMLCLFVLSVAVMAFLFFSEPAQLLMEHKKKEAAHFFVKTVGFFVCFLLIFTILVFIKGGIKEKAPLLPQGKIDVNVVCKSALAYMSFPNSKEADIFVEECVDGKHPEVIQKYIKDLNLDGAKI
jgi:hypothetical protein